MSGVILSFSRQKAGGKNNDENGCRLRQKIKIKNEKEKKKRERVREKKVDVVHQATIRIIITGVRIIYTRQCDTDRTVGGRGGKKIPARKKSVHEIKSLWEPLDRLYFSAVTG
jgi:hypothetical protein